MTAGQKVIKWLMLLFNLIFWISGIGLIVAGAIAQTQYKPFLTFLDGGNYVSAPVLLIVVGAVITIIAFFGCCGSAKENYCMLMTFAVLLGIIFVVELAGGIAGYVERGRVQDYLGKNMRDALNRYNVTRDRDIWAAMQAENHCCGVKGFDDWLNHTGNATVAPGVPKSCCKDQSKVCDRNATSLKPCYNLDASPAECPIYTPGCLDVVSDTLVKNIGAIGGVGIGVAFIQLIGIAFACFLARRIRRGYTYA